MNTVRRFSWWPLLALAACAGEGSDIGPVLPRLPSASSKVLVFDDQGRGVVGAQVTVDAAVVLTGRNGRGELFANARGRVLVAVDGGNGAAVAGDRLGSLRFAATVTGPDLPAAVFLPDFPDSASATVTLGVQAAPTTVTSVAGAILTVPAGATVAHPDLTPTVPLRVGDLQRAHVPGDPPLPVGGGVLLTGRVVCIDPPDVTFAPAIDLDVADDLALGSAAANLFELDPTTGEWEERVPGLVASGGRIVAAGAISRGGIYVLGRAVTAAVVTGRVVDAAGVGVPDVLVAVDGRDTTTDRQGFFTVNGVPAVDASGAFRTVAVELCAGGDWLPVRTATTVAITPASNADTGDLTLDTKPAGNVRVQQIRRGRADPLHPVRLSSVFDETAFVTFGDASGQALFEDVPALWIGFQDGRPIDASDVVYGQSIVFLDTGRRWQDFSQFVDDRPWFLGSRRTRALVCDELGGGPLREAVLVVGTVASSGFVGITQEAGTFFVDRDFDGRATASVRTERDGQSLVHAFSIERPDGEHLELPLRRVLRGSNGAFDRHGLVSGDLVGANPAREHRLRTTRRLDLQEWWDDVVEGQPIRSSLPIDVDPAVTHGAFTIGVDRNGGNLAAAELTVAGGVATLQNVGIVAELVPTEGARIVRDVPLDLPATTAFLVPQGLVGLDASIAVADLRVALALEQPSGRIVDVVRDLGGNHAAAGSDLTLQLPALTGQLAAHRWRALVSGSGAAGGGAVTQRSLLSLRGLGAEAAAPLLAPPVLLSPAPGATVAAAGFTTTFTLPADVLFASLELRSQVGGDTLLWDVVVPPDATTFSFVTLPVESPTPLVAGRTYTLTLSAFRASGGPLRGSPFAYRDLTTFVQSIGTVERGVDSMSSISITITTS